MIRRPPRSTHCISSAASDVYKRQVLYILYARIFSRGIHALSLTWHASSSIGSSALGLFSALQRREPQRVSRERDPIEEAIRFASSEEAVPRRHRKHARKSADKPWVDVVELTASPTPPRRSESPGSFGESSASPLPADLPGSAHADDILAETSPAFLSPTEKAVTASACLLYTSPSPRDRQKSRMPSSA